MSRFYFSREYFATCTDAATENARKQNAALSKSPVIKKG